MGGALLLAFPGTSTATASSSSTAARPSCRSSVKTRCSFQLHPLKSRLKAQPRPRASQFVRRHQSEAIFPFKCWLRANIAKDISSLGSLEFVTLTRRFHFFEICKQDCTYFGSPFVRCRASIAVVGPPKERIFIRGMLFA